MDNTMYVSLSRQLVLQRELDIVANNVANADTNGFKVCEELRRLDRFVPIIMLTARSQEVDKIRGLDAGADDYVTKPFSAPELLARVRAALRRKMRGGAQTAVLHLHEIVAGNPKVYAQMIPILSRYTKTKEQAA